MIKHKNKSGKAAQSSSGERGIQFELDSFHWVNDLYQSSNTV